MPDTPEDFLSERLRKRESEGLRRRLRLSEERIDFASNDYLGFARDGSAHAESTHDRSAPLAAASRQPSGTGSTGSRLLTGHSELADAVEREIARFHSAEAALVFNSGYDANVGLFSSLSREEDCVFYDERIHASVHDGIRLGRGKAFPFRHGDPAHLESRLTRAAPGPGQVYVAVESIYSMDGDEAPLAALTQACARHGARLIVDEAHATGVRGARGEGLTQELGLGNQVFARVHTFGKALGCHGAAVLGSHVLRDYLVNFARPLIYSTALPPHAWECILAGYARLPQAAAERTRLRELIARFRTQAEALRLTGVRPASGPIQSVVIPGNEPARKVAEAAWREGYYVRPILSPTVPKGEERLRICLHSYNTEAETEGLLRCLAQALGESAP